MTSPNAEHADPYALPTRVAVATEEQLRALRMRAEQSVARTRAFAAYAKRRPHDAMAAAILLSTCGYLGWVSVLGVLCGPSE